MNAKRRREEGAGVTLTSASSVPPSFLRSWASNRDVPVPPLGPQHRPQQGEHEERREHLADGVQQHRQQGPHVQGNIERESLRLPAQEPRGKVQVRGA